MGFRLLHLYSAKWARAISRFSFSEPRIFFAFQSGFKSFHIHINEQTAQPLHPAALFLIKGYACVNLTGG